MARTYLVAALLLFALGCSARKEPAKTLTLATTTSTQDSGLLDELLPLFREQTGIEVKVVAVGTGQALQLGRRGDADVLLVHDPASEEAFMKDGFGEERTPMMHNDFIIAGPAADPAKIKQEKTAAGALQRLSRSRSPFVSRGDESGTHLKEKAIWRKAGVEPKGEWYIRSGSGMGAVLRMASEKNGYVLSDRGTFLSQSGKLDLALLFEGDPLLRNPYSVIVVSPAKHPGVKADLAGKFAEFLVSPAAQTRIAKFGAEKYGQPLFSPQLGGKP